MKLNLKKILFGGITGLVLLYVALAFWPVRYEYEPRALPADFKTYYKQKLDESLARKARPNNEEKLIRYSTGKTPLALLYIHGFGASRAEGEAVFDQVGQELGANTYYLRLPGHGTNTLDHASVKYSDYLDLAEEAFAMTQKLGDKVVLVGCSTGALLATYLAARHPDKVHSLILGSPFYGYRDLSAKILGLPGGLSLVKLLYGEDRDAGWKENPQGRVRPGYNDHWLTKQKYRALVELEKLRAFVAQKHNYRRITSPALVFYYYKDDTLRDGSINLKDMKEAYALFGTAERPHTGNRLVAIADGNHILFSKYVRTDKELILSEIRKFFSSLDLNVSAGKSGGQP